MTDSYEIDAVEKITAELRREQADYAVLAERNNMAIAALANISRMIEGRNIVTGWDDGGRQAAIDAALFDLIQEEISEVVNDGKPDDDL